MKNNHIIMLFIDGFGIGKANIEENPLSADYMPYLNNCLGRPPTTLEVFENEKLIYIPTDANLGLKGIPQSATGQTTLFTGCNASKILGYHLPAYPNKPLIKLINQYSIFKQLVSLGYIPTSANAYSQEYFKLVEKGKLKHSATTLSVLAAQNENPQKSNLAFRMEKEMKNDEELLDWVLDHCTVIFDSLEVDNRELLAELVEEMEQEQLDAYRENEPHEYE